MITTVDSRDELWDLVEELGVHLEGEEIDVSDDEDMYLNEGDKNLQEVYDALLEDCDKYAKVPKSVVKDAKCEVEKPKEELLNAYSKIKFLKLEVIQANVKVECITIKKLDSVLSSQRPSTDKTDLGYTGEGSSSGEPKKKDEVCVGKECR